MSSVHPRNSANEICCSVFFVSVRNLKSPVIVMHVIIIVVERQGNAKEIKFLCY